jgi:hypothetical protein
MSNALELELRPADFLNMVDAVFDPDHEMPGWVIMAANKKGRKHIEALFPEARIAWREPGPGFPRDWRGFKINLRDAVSGMKTKLALNIIPAGHTIADCTPEQHAALLALSVTLNGGRAAIVEYKNGKPLMHIVGPQER